MKRIVSLLLSLVMVAGMMPQRVVATENPCSHTHDDSCYTVKCAHVHGECSYVEGDPEIPCDHDCTQDAACAEKVLSCTHVHDDSCSYTEAEGNQDPEDMATPDEEIGSGTPDGTPPVLNGLTISATEVTIPGEIEVIVEASDDVSGVKYVEVRFFCESTDKYLYCHAEEVDSDGKFHATLKLDQYVESGTFVVDRVDLEDEAENFILYNRTNPERPLPESVKNLSFQVVEGEKPDGNPPVLNGVTISADTVTVPGEIEVVVDVADDVSGVKYVEVRFFCESTNKYLYCHADEVSSDGKFHATLKLDQYVESGTFVVQRIDLEDNAENYIIYNHTNPESPLPESVKSLSFQAVESENPDGEPPVLNEIAISVDSITAPGEIEVIVDAGDDVSGVRYAEVRFFCESTNKYLYCHADEVSSDGKFHAILKLDQYVESGTFVIDRVDLEDNAENYIIYNSTNPKSPLPESVKQIMLNVFNTVPDVTTSVSKSDFIDVVKSATDNAYIAADYSGDATMPKAAFEAIAGTNKTIDLISAGITWRFEGNDITEEIKDIDLKVEIQKVEDDSSASGDAIESSLNGNPGVVMKFPENGTLPGKATIQVKVDYAMREYLGSSEGLSVYYYNNKTGEMELIASDLKVINDTYVEFPITHCSYYVLTATGNTSGGGSNNRCGENLTWSFDKTTGTLTISGTGAMYDYTSANNVPWYLYGSQVKELVIENGVTRIGDYAFRCCTAAKKTSIPQSINQVGQYAFANVTDARFVIDQTVRQWSEVQDETQYFPDWEYTSFVNQASVVASGLYGEHVFWELDQAGDMVFFGTGAMYDFGAVPTPWGDLSVRSITLEEGITRIGHCAFEVAVDSEFSQNLLSVTIPSTVTSVGGLVFSVCKKLEAITFVGDAPRFDPVSFNGVTATAHYPAGNSTWTETVMQDYGGAITWEAYCPGHAFGEWITEGNTSSRTCTLCGYTEHKVTTDSGDVEIEIPEQPDLEVEVDPVLPSEDSYVLVEKAFDSVDNQDQAILKVFDINLKNVDGVHVQPNGTVKVKLPLDWEKDGNYKVYRVNDDKTLTDMNAYRQGSHMVFETDHFSLYVIVEEGHRHDYQKIVTAPDCTEDGFTTYTCGCGSSYVDDEVAALGHSYDKGKITTKPTCMAEGVKTYTCGTCGDTKTEPVEKDQKNHSFTKYESDKNATCKKDGTKTAKCDHGCGKTDTVTDWGSKLGHKYQGDKCIRCGVTRWNPDTGDKIMIAVGTMAVSAVALLVLLIWKKKK